MILLAAEMGNPGIPSDTVPAATWVVGDEVPGLSDMVCVDTDIKIREMVNEVLIDRALAPASKPGCPPSDARRT